MAELGTDVTGTQTETGSAETEVQETTGAAEEATAGEAKAKEGEAKAAEAKPEDDETRRKNREAYERRQERKRLRDLELENAELRGFNRALQNGGKTEAKSDTAEAEALFAQRRPKPTPDQFGSTAEFHEALTDWKMDLREFRAEQGTRRTQETQKQAEFVQKLETQRERGEEKYEDFQELVSAVEYAPATMAAITESDRGEDVAYYLAGNPAEFARISKLSPFLQAKEVGRIEAGLESGKIQIKTTTKAPPPPATVGGKSNAGKKSIFDQNLSTADRIAISRARRQERR